MSKSKDLKIVVFGDVKFSTALLSLEGIVGVVTKSQVVAQIAAESKIPLVVSGECSTEEDAMNLLIELEKVGVNLIVISGYNAEIPQEILDYPLYGSIEIRPSLTPGYSGKNAINWSVLNGDDFSGCTAFYRNLPPEDGSIEVISSIKLPISKEDTAGEIYKYLFDESKTTMEEIAKKIKEETSDEAPFLVVTETIPEFKEMPVIDKAFRKLAFVKETDEVLRKIKGLSPMPGAYTELKFREDLSLALNILDASGVIPKELPTNHKPGAVRMSENSMKIDTLDGYIEIKQVQVNNKRQQSIADFISSHGLIRKK